MWKFKWVPQTPKVSCRARVCPVHNRPPPHHQLWWWLQTTSVGPSGSSWPFPTPLLPGSVDWPLVWPITQWTPPSLVPKVCPQSGSVSKVQSAYFSAFSLIVLIACYFWLIWVCLTYLYLIYPLWTPPKAIWAHLPKQST